MEKTLLLRAMITTTALCLLLATNNFVAEASRSDNKILIAERGSTVRLWCDFPVEPEVGQLNKIPEVSWHHRRQRGSGLQRGVTLPASISRGRQDVSTPFNTGSSELAKVDFGNSGIWFCADKSTHKILDFFKLYVIPPRRPSMIFTGFEVVEANNSLISLGDDEAADFLCVVRDGEAVMKINGHEARGHVVKSHLISSESGVIVSYKHIRRKLERSAANLTCNSGFHGLNLAASTMVIRLGMDYAPSFTIRRDPQFGIPVIEGMTVTLECEVDSRPATERVKWLKNEAVLENGNLDYLLITNVGMDDVGWYQCSTVYKNETYSSIGYFLNVAPAMASVHHDTAKANLDEAAEADEPPLIDSSSISSSSDKDLTARSQKKQFEMARNVLFQKDTCAGCCPLTGSEASRTGNGSGRYGLPKIRLVKGTEAVIEVEAEADNFTLHVEVCANPPANRIIWELPTGELLKGGQQNQISDRLFEAKNRTLPSKPTCSLASLIGRASTLENNSEKITVVALNRDGFAEKSFRIEVEKNREIDSDLVEATPHQMASGTGICDKTVNLIGLNVLLLISYLNT